MSTTLIYILKDPVTNEPRYVGKCLLSSTNNLKKRYRKHIYESRLKRNHRECWIYSLTVQKLYPIIEIIDEVSQDWEFWEEHYIWLYRSWGFDLVNMSFGGESPKLTYESRKKISEKQKGKIISEESKRKMSLSHRGIKSWNKGLTKNTNDTMKNISKALSGRKRDDLSIQKIGKNNPMYGKKLTKNHKIKISNGLKKYIKKNGFWHCGTVSKNRKAVVQYDIDGNILNEWVSINHAAKSLNISSGNISRACNLNNPYIVHGKFKFQFKK